MINFYCTFFLNLYSIVRMLIYIVINISNIIIILY